MCSTYYSRWASFIREFYSLVLFWLAGVLMLTGFRTFYLWYFRELTSKDIEASEYLQLYHTGFAFDSNLFGILVCTLFLLSCVLIPLRLEKAYRLIAHIARSAFWVTCVLLCCITVTYIEQYQTQFNYIMFEMLYEDNQAIVETIFAHHQPWGSFLTAVALISLGIAISLKLMRWQPQHLFLQSCRPWYFKSAVTVCMLAVMTLIFQGSTDSRKASRKNIAATSDPFLNQLVVNPVRQLNYALRDFKEFNQAITQYNTLYTPKEFQALSSQNLSRVSQGPQLSHRPSHIFFIVMESFDSWPRQDKFAHLNLTPEFDQLSKQGLYVEAAVQASDSTMNSLSSFLSGLPYAGINMSQIGTDVVYEDMGIFHLMAQQGYQPHFYYGGKMSWQNVGNYALSQGAIRSESAMLDTSKKHGVWGASDETLFNYVQSRLDDAPSFNVILTTSYHSPYAIDLSQFDTPFKSQVELEQQLNTPNKNILTYKALNHLWYSDKMLGQFIKQTQLSHPDALFVVTGDHYARHYMYGRPNSFEASHVPILMYGKGIPVKQFSSDEAISHIDITPTLMDLVAKKQTPYRSFGRSLLSSSYNTKAIGFNTVKSQKTVWQQATSTQYQGYNIEHIEQVKQAPPAELVEYYDTMMGLSRFMLLNPKLAQTEDTHYE